ncbi:hypothetical protein [Streptosporangium sp. NPDC087985]|uniref:hypothetical protein n=1 Tax=Streptosporangium sp. NPDC087985 TaxID=3366196 RepID=UPI003826DCFC
MASLLTGPAMRHDVRDRIDRVYTQPLDVEAPARDVSMIDGEVEVLEIDALPQERGDRFAARTGFDPRALATPYRWFRISPRRIQAWREVNELSDRADEEEPGVLLEAG